MSSRLDIKLRKRHYSVEVDEGKVTEIYHVKFRAGNSVPERKVVRPDSVEYKTVANMVTGYGRAN